jgi:lipopolysaccharide export system protein LptC
MTEGPVRPTGGQPLVARANLPRVRGAALPAGGRDPRFRTGRATPGYSRFVLLMKLVLPSLAVVMLGVILAWPQISERAEGLAVEFVTLDRRHADLGSIINPRYVGTDEQDQPYMVTADTATEMADGSGRVRLSNPKGDLTQTTGRWLSVTSELGYLSDGNQRVELEHNVMLYRDDGFQFETSKAFILMDENRAYGSQPVKGQGEKLEITSDSGFRVDEGGDVILFQGKSHLILLETDDGTDSGGGASGVTEEETPR